MEYLLPDPDHRPAIKGLQWIQLMLDTCATTEEVIERSRKVRISQEAARLQYLVCDAGGEVCIIEFILGDMVLIRGEDLKYPVIANDMYETSIDYLNIHEGYGGRKELQKSDLSVDRFAVTADAVTHNEYTEPEDCLEILDLAGFGLTQWSIVYDPINLRVLYRSKKSPEIKSIDLSKFNFSNMNLPLVKEVDGSGEFQDFSVEEEPGTDQVLFP